MPLTSECLYRLIARLLATPVEAQETPIWRIQEDWRLSAEPKSLPVVHGLSGKASGDLMPTNAHVSGADRRLGEST